MNVNYKAYLPYLKFLLLAALIYFPVFGHLDTLPIRIWDEARLAINSYEMLQNRDFMVTHFEGKPDMWNTKPPFLIWVQVVFIKMLNVNELSIRLPSAFAVFFTCLALLVFSLRYLKSFWLGSITVLVLITASGYIGLHAGRTGDYDAMLTLFTTLSGLFCFAYCETGKKRNLYFFLLATTLAVLTKGISGLIFGPALFIYVWSTGNLRSLLGNKHFYVGLTLFLLLIGGYYGLREFYNPGYLAAVRENEWGGRYLEVIEEHKAPFWYYLHNFVEERFHYWYLLLPCGFITGLVIRDQRLRRLNLFAGLMTLVWFLVISTAKTKLPWYDVPMYPFMAITVSLFIYTLFKLISGLNVVTELKFNIFPYLFLLLLFAVPYQIIFSQTNPPKEKSEMIDFYEIGYYLKGGIKGYYDLNNQYLLYDGYNAQNLFYINILQDKGIQVNFRDWKHLKPGEVVFTQQENIKHYLANHYRTDTLQTVGKVITYKITAVLNKK